MLISLFLPPLTLGLLTLVFGLRGKRLDHHPVCRRCRYDLIGSPKPRLQCSECGADLLSTRAIHIGNRRKRPTPIVIGTLLILIATGLAGAQLWQANLNPYKPFWLLQLQATTPSQASNGGELDELLTRTKSSSLSASQLDSLMGSVLHAQADTSTPWNETWGDTFAELFTQGIGTQAQHEQFAKNVYRFELTARPRVRLGDPIIIQTPYRHHRGHGKQAKHYRVQSGERFTIGKLTDQRGGSTSGFAAGSGSSGTSMSTDRPPFNQLTLGHHELTMTLPVEIRLGSGKGPLIGRFVLTKSAPLEIIPADTHDDIQMFKDPLAAAAMEAGTSINNHQIKIRPQPRHPERFTADLQINLRGTTAPFGYQIIASSDGHEWDLVTIASNAPVNDSRSSFGTSWPPEITADHIDLIFRPSPIAARKTADVHLILDHEFVIKDVQVVRQP